jgi:hypothetical protein
LLLPVEVLSNKFQAEIAKNFLCFLLGVTAVPIAFYASVVPETNKLNSQKRNGWVYFPFGIYFGKYVKNGD